MTTPYVSPSDKYRMEPGKTYCRVEIVIDDGYFAHVTYYDQAGSRTEEESLSDDGSSLIARLKDEGWQEVHVSHIQGVGQTHFFERQHASEAGKVVFPKKSASTVVNPYDRARMEDNVEYAEVVWYRDTPTKYVKYYSRKSSRSETWMKDVNIREKFNSEGWHEVYATADVEGGMIYYEREGQPENILKPSTVPAGQNTAVITEKAQMDGGERCRVVWKKGDFFVVVEQNDKSERRPGTTLQKVVSDLEAQGWLALNITEEGGKSVYTLGRGGVKGDIAPA